MWHMAQVPAAFHVVVIGGTVPSAVVEVVAELSRRSGFAIVTWCPVLDAGELRAVVKVPVTELVERAQLLANRVYLAPADRRVAVEGDELVVGGVDRSPLDLLFRRVADAWAEDCSGVVLAGHGRDGSLGIKRIKEAGGLTIAQHVVGPDHEMPGAALESGLIDLVLPLDEIASKLAAHGAVDDSSFDDAESRREKDARADALHDILNFVRVRTSHDFTAYKRATLYRRIARRMQVCNCVTLDSYHRHLREHPGELADLLRDLLISVTNFFRDPDAFAALANEVLPRMFAGKGPNDQVRVWVTGCATGEEAYSLGILLLEHAATLRKPPALQIFATDIDERALAEARVGTYPEAISADVSAERLQRFFIREGDRYRVVKELRDQVLFSPHNVLRDPPFSRLDLVSCRNLLIYLNREAQARVLTMFHFGLRSEGVLFLGSSESAETSALFGSLDQKHRLFSRRAATASLGEAVAAPTRWQPPLPPAPSYTPPDRSPSLGELHYRIVENYAPPSALLNPDLDVVHLSEHAGRYLQLAGGEPTRQVLRLVHPGLQLELRTAIYTARQHGSERRTVRYDDHGEHRTVELHVRQVELPELGRGSMLVTFEDVPADPTAPVQAPPSAAMEPIVREMEDELVRTRSQLRTTIEQYETSVEELKASNEELQAINEELRSATEELETSKEELQSVNEELTTLNQELKSKVDEISRANSDLQNLITSTDIGVMFLDRNLDIKRFTPRVQDVVNVIPSDIGRPVAHVTHRLVDAELAGNAQAVLSTLRPIEKRVVSHEGRTYLVRWLPYRSLEDRIEGVVVTLVDVSDLRDAVEAGRRSQHALEAVEERLRIALASVPIAVFSFDGTARPTWAYVAGREHPDAGAAFATLLAPDDAHTLVEAVRRVQRTRHGEHQHLALRHGGVARTFDFDIEPGANGVTVIGFDISESKRAEAALRDADVRKDEFLATLSHELRNPLAPLKVALEVARLAGHDDKQRAESLGVVARQVDMLQTLVDELLDLSRLTHDKVELVRVPLDLAAVVARAVETAGPRIADAGQRLDLRAPPRPVRTVGDVGRLVQVVTNLLSNASKFSPQGGHIEVEIAEDVARARAVIRVIDHGQGIDPQALSSIFDIFVQTRHEDGRTRGGLGIGLNVVKRLVELHGGQAFAASSGPGHGSTLTVELPLMRG